MKRGDISTLTRGYSSHVFVLLPLLSLLTSCQLGPPTAELREALARGDDQLVHRDFHGAMETFRSGLDATGNDELKASALLGLGRAYSGLGHDREALEFFSQAQRIASPLSRNGSATGNATGTAIELALGEIHCKQGDYVRAASHLERALGRNDSGDRPRLLVLAGICAHRNHDHQLGDRHLRKVPLATHPELEALVLEHIPDYHERSRRGWRDPIVRLPKPTKTRPDPVGPVKVFSRRQWNARSIRANRTTMGDPYRITLHHTGTDQPFSQSQSEAASTIKSIQRVHQRDRGWADIGYHYIIDRSGRVWQGRDLHFQGAHARGRANRGNIGIVLLGNFTRQKVTRAQAMTLGRFLTHLCKRHGVSRSKVYTHSEVLGGSTQCPGPEVARLIRRFRQQRLALAQ